MDSKMEDVGGGESPCLGTRTHACTCALATEAQPTHMSAFALTNAANLSAYPYETCSCTAMSNLVAPTAATAARPQLDIVVVVDTSGSMGGRKMDLVKSTLELLVTRAGLRSADRFGMVTFSSSVISALPLTQMDAAGLARAKKVVGSLHAGGGTNLSGGLLQGIDMMTQHAGAGEGAADATRIILLLTDGQATVGICDPAELVASAQGALSGSPCQIFTFGFGADHNEDVLQSIATSTASLYYYIKEADSIPTAFADCLGGLISVVAQNAVLELKAGGGSHRLATIVTIVGDAYPTTLSEDGAVATVRLGDLYSEDEKNVLFELQLAAQSTDQPPPVARLESAVDGLADFMLVSHDQAREDPAEKHPPAEEATEEAPRAGICVLETTLRYFCVSEKRMKEVAAPLSVVRAQDTSHAIVCTRLDAQHNRLLVAEALKQATSYADQGQLTVGKRILDEVIATVSASPSAASQVSQELLEDVRRLRVGYESQLDYSTWGSKRSKMSSASHRYERSTHDTPTDADGRSASYRGGSSSKSSLKRTWGAS